jgi:hypothetical protein
VLYFGEKSRKTEWFFTVLGHRWLVVGGWGGGGAGSPKYKHMGRDLIRLEPAVSTRIGMGYDARGLALGLHGERLLSL